MKKKLIKCTVLSFVVILVFVLLFLVVKNLFVGSVNLRYEGIENYKLTNDEINIVKDKINELDGIKTIDIYTHSKIIKIVVKLEQDIDFESIKAKANESISGFSEKNLSYYDVQFYIDFIEQENQIGYKFKANSEFSW